VYCVERYKIINRLRKKRQKFFRRRRALVNYLQRQLDPLIQVLSERKTLLEVSLATAASSMFILSLFLPWWNISSNIGTASAPLWSAQAIQGWAPLASDIRPDWYLLLPVVVAALIAILLAGTSWKEGTALHVLISIIVPMEILSAQGLLFNYLGTYLNSVVSAPSNSGSAGYFTGTPGVGIILYLGGYGISTVLLAFKVLMNDNVPMGRVKILSILVVFSGFYWYLIGSIAFPGNPAWPWVMLLDSAFIETTALLLWYSRRNGWLSMKAGWRDRLQLLFLPTLVLLDAVTTNYAIPVTGSSGPLTTSGTTVRDASLLVNTVQSSGVPQAAYLFWTLLTLQVIALSYLSLGLTSNTKLGSFPRFLASYALNMMITAYAFTVSNNLLLIFTGRTWFANSEALVLVIALAVTFSFLVSISNVWGLTRLGDLMREWKVRY
jgi:hypothetical protein